MPKKKYIVSLTASERTILELKIGHATIERVRQRFVEEGIESALNRREQKNGGRRIIDGEKEAYLIEIGEAGTARSLVVKLQ